MLPCIKSPCNTAFFALYCSVHQLSPQVHLPPENSQRPGEESLWVILLGQHFITTVKDGKKQQVGKHIIRCMAEMAIWGCPFVGCW